MMAFNSSRKRTCLKILALKRSVKNNIGLREYSFLLLFLLFKFFTPSSNAQPTYKSPGKNQLSYLDTIIRTKLPCRENPNIEFAFASHDQHAYFSYASNLQRTNVTIYSLNLLTYQLDSICFKQKKRDIIPYAGRFAINRNYLAISGHQSFAVYKRNSSTGEYALVSKEMDVKYYHLWLDGDLLKLTYCYNYYRDDDKAGFGVYDLKTNTWISQKKLNTNGIYFTHFTPSQLLSFNGSNILALDPVNYSITMFDINGQKIDSFSRGFINWNALDLRVQKRLIDHLKHLPGKDVISYLNQHRLKIDRCQQIISLSPDTFLVSYYRFDSIGSKVDYSVDYYSINNGKIQLMKGEIDDVTDLDSSVRINHDFPSMHTYNAHLVSPKNLIVFRNIVPINYWNKTIGEISALEEEYFMNSDGKLALFVFRLKI